MVRPEEPDRRLRVVGRQTGSYHGVDPISAAEFGKSAKFGRPKLRFLAYEFKILPKHSIEKANLQAKPPGGALPFRFARNSRFFRCMVQEKCSHPRACSACGPCAVTSVTAAWPLRAFTIRPIFVTATPPMERGMRAEAGAANSSS